MKYKDRLQTGRYPYRFDVIHTIRFRYDPIPHTGGARWGCYYRRIRTKQELTLNEAYVGYTRGKRRKKLLPNSWDDIGRNDFRDTSWKNCTKRKRQYK